MYTKGLKNPSLVKSEFLRQWRRLKRLVPHDVGIQGSYTARRDSLKSSRPKSRCSGHETADGLSWHWTESRLAVYETGNVGDRALGELFDLTGDGQVSVGDVQRLFMEFMAES